MVVPLEDDPVVSMIFGTVGYVDDDYDQEEVSYKSEGCV